MGAFHVPLHNNVTIIISHRVTRPITINDVPKYITVAVAQVNNIIVIIVIWMVKEWNGNNKTNERTATRHWRRRHGEGSLWSTRSYLLEYSTSAVWRVVKERWSPAETFQLQFSRWIERFVLDRAKNKTRCGCKGKVQMIIINTSWIAKGFCRP